MAFIDDIKPYFQTGDYPTQSQFYEAFDKLRWKDETQAISSITGLQDILNSFAGGVTAFTTAGDQPFTIPVGYLLEHIILKPVADCNVRCDVAGTITPGDVVMELAVTAAEGTVWVINKMAFADTNIVVVGMPAGSKVYFVKRKIY